MRKIQDRWRHSNHAVPSQAEVWLFFFPIITCLLKKLSEQAALRACPLYSSNHSAPHQCLLNLKLYCHNCSWSYCYSTRATKFFKESLAPQSALMHGSCEFLKKKQPLRVADVIGSLIKKKKERTLANQSQQQALNQKLLSRLLQASNSVCSPLSILIVFDVSLTISFFSRILFFVLLRLLHLKISSPALLSLSHLVDLSRGMFSSFFCSCYFSGLTLSFGFELLWSSLINKRCQNGQKEENTEGIASRGVEGPSGAKTWGFLSAQGVTKDKERQELLYAIIPAGAILAQKEQGDDMEGWKGFCDEKRKVITHLDDLIGLETAWRGGKGSISSLFWSIWDRLMSLPKCLGLPCHVVCHMLWIITSCDLFTLGGLLICGIYIYIICGTLVYICLNFFLRVLSHACGIFLLCCDISIGAWRSNSQALDQLPDIHYISLLFDLKDITLKNFHIFSMGPFNISSNF
ncbi:hypothetical protein VP01_83g7 [Puccinia sorghi]|uniref:Uncharacterized protein n=1 Tax=Puccinia sorghi TaxID=27349 RepID=A0A0L6U9F6_9BASI|nr:hypothetical protein VP01_83g7 [Puccinia sorghi]